MGWGKVDFTITPLIMVIVGTFIGRALGALLIHLTEEAPRDTVITIGALGVNIGERWALILGLTFILIVLIFPRGIVGSVQAWWGARNRKGCRPPVAGLHPTSATQETAQAG